MRRTPARTPLPTTGPDRPGRRRSRARPPVESLEPRALLTGLTPAQIQAIGAAVDGFLAANELPGAGVAVVKDGQVALATGYGLADAATRAPVDADTAFAVGSVTKTYTAMAVMTLVDQGRLDLDAPIGDYLTHLPDIPNSQGPPTPGGPLPGEWAPITARQLLTMTGGITDAASNTQPWQEVLRRASVGGADPAHQLDFAPGTMYEYTDAGFMLLGDLVQTVSGQAYSDFLRQYVFTPLGLSGRTVVRTGTEGPGQAVGYQDWDPQTMTWDRPSRYREGTSSFSSGAISTTAADAGLYLEALMDRQLLAPSSYADMFSALDPPVRAYEGGALRFPGLGWDSVEPIPGVGIRITKDGSIPGYSAQYTLYPNLGLAVAVLVNLADHPNPARPLALTTRVLQAIVGERRYPSDFDLPTDFDGAGTSGVAVYRPDTSQFFLRNPDGATQSLTFGPGSLYTGAAVPPTPLSGDFNGMGRAGVGVYRPDTSEFFLRNADGTTLSFAFGPGSAYTGAAIQPVGLAGDFDGAGRYGVAVYRPDTSEFFLRDADGDTRYIPFGPGSAYTGAAVPPVPLAADFTGGGRMGVAVYRPDLSQFFVRDADGTTAFIPFGPGSAYTGAAVPPVPLVGDWAGGGRSGVGVYRPDTSEFFLRDADGVARGFSFGPGGAYTGAAVQPVPFAGDFDGGGKIGVGVYRPDLSQFFVRDADGTTAFIPFGPGSAYTGATVQPVALPAFAVAQAAPAPARARGGRARPFSV